MRSLDSLAYSAVALGTAIGLFGLVITWSTTLLVVSGGILGVSAVLFRFGDWILPSLLGMAGRHPVYDTLEIDDDAVLMREGSTWVAVAYFIMEVHHTPLEEPEKTRVSYFTMLTSLFSHLPSRCVISQYMSPVDVGEVRRRLRRELNNASVEMASASRDKNMPRERELKQKVKELEHQMETLDRDRPIDVAFFAKVSATGTTREGAKEEVKAVRERLESSVRGVLRVTTREARGQELKRLVKLDMVVPTRELI